MFPNFSTANRIVRSLLPLAVLIAAASPAEATARLRFGHLSPDAPPVDVLLNGRVVIAGLEFLETSDALSVTPGQYRVEVTAASNREAVVIDALLPLEGDTSTTIVATGLLSDNDLLPVVLQDPEPAEATQARVRFTHASPDAPAVDVALAGGAVLFPDVSFRQSSDVLTVDGGSYDLEVRLAGTSTVVLELPGIELASGTVSEAFATGLVGDETLGAKIDDVTRTFSEEPALVRVAHLSPDAPAVDVRVDGALVLAGLSFSAVSEYLALESGIYRVRVTPAGATEPVVIDADLAIEGGQAYTVAATGLLGDDSFGPLVLEDDRSVSSQEARVRFVHASPDAPAIDVALAGGGAVLFGDVAFRDNAGTISVAPGEYNLEVRLAGTQTVVLPLPGVSLEAGVAATVFAVGEVADESLAALPAVDRDERFVRGDSNRDQSVNLSDAAATLGFLFLGLETSLCLDAADANDDGHLTLTDPIFTLEYLFAGGARLPAPFPAVGLDTTADEFTCE